MPDIKRIIEVIISATNRSGPGVAAASADLEKYGSRLTTVGTIAVTTGAAVAGAMAAIVVSTANAEDRIRDLAIQSNSTAETMSTLKYVAEQNGTTIDAVAQSMKFLARNAADAAGGNKEMAQSFADVGVNVRNADGSLKSSEQLLFDVADGLKGTSNATEATRLSLALLGRGSIELTEFLKLGSAGLRDGQAEARKFGAEISTKAAAGADKFNDSLNTLKFGVEGLARGIGDQLIPTLAPMIIHMAEAAAKTGAWAREHPGLAKGIAIVATALIGGGGLVVALGTLATNFATIAPLAATAWAAITGPVGLMLGITAAVAALVLKLSDLIGKAQEAKSEMNRGGGVSQPTGVFIGSPGSKSGGKEPGFTENPFFHGATPPAAAPGGGGGGGGGTPLSDEARKLQQEIDLYGRLGRARRDAAQADAEFSDLSRLASDAGSLGGSPGFGGDAASAAGSSASTALSFAKQLGQQAAESLASIPSLASTAVGGLMTLGDVAGQFVADGFKISADAAAQWAKSLIASIVSIIAKAAILAGILGIIGLGGGASFGTLFKKGLGIPGLASGGIVRGGVSGQDSVLAALMPGEMVLPAPLSANLERALTGSSSSRPPVVNQVTMPVQYYFGRETDAREAAVKIQRQLDELQRGTRL